jgi:hypothetical protein
VVHLAFEIPLLGERARVQMSLLPWSEVAAVSIRPETMAASRLPSYFASNLKGSIEAVDGKPLARAARQALEADPHAQAAFFARRFAIYEEIRAAGRVFARCPHCKSGEVEMSLLALGDAVGVMPPEMFSSDHIYFRAPASGPSRPTPTRSEQFSYAERIRCELPTKLLGLSRTGFDAGVLGRFRYERYRELMARWETDGVNVPAEQGWRTSRHEGFCTTMWLIAALRETMPSGEVTLETFEQLPGVDVYFLDASFHLAFEVELPAHARERACPTCARAFMPVAAFDAADVA